MEKQETHAPHHDENQKTHAPATMPCACTGYGEPLPRLPINTVGENRKVEGKDKKKEEKFFGEQREASCRNGEEKGRKKERAGEDGQAAETAKKKGNQRGQNF
jgi:hypothetical protein